MLIISIGSISISSTSLSAGLSLVKQDPTKQRISELHSETEQIEKHTTEQIDYLNQEMDKNYKSFLENIRVHTASAFRNLISLDIWKMTKNLSLSNLQYFHSTFGVNTQDFLYKFSQDTIALDIKTLRTNQKWTLSLMKEVNRKHLLDISENQTIRLYHYSTSSLNAHISLITSPLVMGMFIGKESFQEIEFNNKIEQYQLEFEHHKTEVINALKIAAVLTYINVAKVKYPETQRMIEQKDMLKFTNFMVQKLKINHNSSEKQIFRIQQLLDIFATSYPEIVAQHQSNLTAIARRKGISLADLTSAEMLELNSNQTKPSSLNSVTNNTLQEKQRRTKSSSQELNSRQMHKAEQQKLKDQTAKLDIQRKKLEQKLKIKISYYPNLSDLSIIGSYLNQLELIPFSKVGGLEKITLSSRNGRISHNVILINVSTNQPILNLAHLIEKSFVLRKQQRQEGINKKYLRKKLSEKHKKKPIITIKEARKYRQLIKNESIRLGLVIHIAEYLVTQSVIDNYLEQLSKLSSKDLVSIDKITFSNFNSFKGKNLTIAAIPSVDYVDIIPLINSQKKMSTRINQKINSLELKLGIKIDVSMRYVDLREVLRLLNNLEQFNNKQVNQLRQFKSIYFTNRSEITSQNTFALAAQELNGLDINKELAKANSKLRRSRHNSQNENHQAEVLSKHLKISIIVKNKYVNKQSLNAYFKQLSKNTAKDFAGLDSIVFGNGKTKLEQLSSGEYQLGVNTKDKSSNNLSSIFKRNFELAKHYNQRAASIGSKLGINIELSIGFVEYIVIEKQLNEIELLTAKQLHGLKKIRLTNHFGFDNNHKLNLISNESKSTSLPPSSLNISKIIDEYFSEKQEVSGKLLLLEKKLNIPVRLREHSTDISDLKKLSNELDKIAKIEFENFKGIKSITFSLADNTEKHNKGHLKLGVLSKHSKPYNYTQLFQKSNVASSNRNVLSPKRAVKRTCQSMFSKLQ
jgi:hypothetical protein